MKNTLKLMNAKEALAKSSAASEKIEKVKSLEREQFKKR